MATKAQPTTITKKGKRKEAPPSDIQQKKRRRVTAHTQISDIEDPNLLQIDNDGELNQNEPNSDLGIDLETEEEEQKPKPILGLRYQGFSIYGHCLCVVVEPWPIIRSVPQPAVFAGLHKRTGPSESSGQAKDSLPLFLPEETQEEATPQRETQVNKSYLNHILREEPTTDSDDGMDGLVNFSQVLQNVGETRVGGTNDDDDDGDAFMLSGDADEYE